MTKVDAFDRVYKARVPAEAFATQTSFHNSIITFYLYKNKRSQIYIARTRPGSIEINSIHYVSFYREIESSNTIRGKGIAEQRDKSRAQVNVNQNQIQFHFQHRFMRVSYKARAHCFLSYRNLYRVTKSTFYCWKIICLNHKSYFSLETIL